MASFASHVTPLQRVFQWMRADRNDMLLVLLYAIASSIVALTIPVTVQAMVNTVAFGAVIQPIVVLAFLVFAGLATAAVFRALQAQVVETIQERIFARSALELSHLLPKVDASVRTGSHLPELVNRFFDIITLQKSGASLLVDGSALALQTLVGMVVLAFYHPFLLAFDVVLLGAMAFVFFVLGRGAERTAIAESKAKYATAAWLEELARHLLVFKTPGGRALAVERTHGLTDAYLRGRRDHWRVLFRQIVGALALYVVFASALIAIGGILVLNKQLTLGQLVSSEIIVTGVLLGFSKVGKQLESLYDMLAGFDKLGGLLDLPEERAARGAFLDQHTGPAAVTLRSVAFRGVVDGALHEASLDAGPGERVALTGPDSSAKSTLLDLLYGLVTATEGSVEIDGEPLHTIAPWSLRKQVAMVRGAEIFAGSIIDNIRAGRAEVSQEDVRAALEDVELWNHVKALPRGIDTELTTYGPTLSTSDAKKLVLARATVGRPRLLLLDGPLDDLDPATRERVARFLFAKERGWTVVCATKDPALPRLCTRSVVVAQGRLGGLS